jgi:hypothetical protein
VELGGEGLLCLTRKILLFDEGWNFAVFIV